MHKQPATYYQLFEQCCKVPFLSKDWKCKKTEGKFVKNPYLCSVVCFSYHVEFRNLKNW